MENTYNTLDEPQLVLASRNKRLLNFLIDYIMVFVVLMTFMVVLEVAGISVEEMAEGIIGNILSILFYFLCYVMIEGGSRGKTLGKAITKTRVVTLAGEQPDFETFIKRSLIRLVPFEPFSFFGSEVRGWHDRWSDTMVIDETESDWYL